MNSTGQARVIDNDIVEHERKKKYEIKRKERFRYRTRYFTDSSIIGIKEFVSSNYQRFKDFFMSKRQKIPKRVAGLNGVYSLSQFSTASCGTLWKCFRFPVINVIFIDKAIDAICKSGCARGAPCFSRKLLIAPYFFAAEKSNGKMVARGRRIVSKCLSNLVMFEDFIKP